MADKHILRALTGTDETDPRNRPLRPVDIFALLAFGFLFLVVFLVIRGAVG